MAKPMLAVFGDSIAVGLGSRGGDYASIVAEELGFSLCNFAVSGFTIRDSLNLFRKTETRPALAIVAHGITEPIFRPVPRTLQLLPARWQRLGWMDPRAYYSTRLSRRILEKIESGVRWRTKNIFMKLFGTSVLLPLDSYLECAKTFEIELSKLGCRVIFLSPLNIDAKFFPGSDKSQESYYSALESLGFETIDLRSILTMWDDYLLDHFHPNQTGHRKIADSIVSYFKE